MSRFLYYLAIFSIILSMGCQNNPSNSGNLLSQETSPYLLQHANNPVNWLPWNEATLDKALKEQKPIIISVGYAACHWCHVMEEESFEDSTVAAIMNEHFISIKVDREERPDIDQIYMTACQLATNEGCGWPLNAMALPDGRPFWATTYLPKENWLKALTYFKDLYINEQDQVIQAADRLEEGISTLNLLPKVEDPTINKVRLQYWNLKMADGLDAQQGGRKGSPKFPLPGLLDYMQKGSFLLDNQKSLNIVDTSLTKMAYGGIYDHIGGGFARYSTDAQWHIPHFEKMLYDNAQLIGLYSKAYRRTQNELYKDRVEETIGFILKHWKDPNGGFYSSFDADSYNKEGEKEEGAFYVWTQEEVQAVIGDDTNAKAFFELYDIQKVGIWEKGLNVLQKVHSEDAVAQKFGLDPAQFQKFCLEARSKLEKVRALRPTPTLDNKILCNWNALLITGLTEAYRAFGNADYLKEALQLASFMEKSMIQSDGQILRSVVDGQAGIIGFLDDYALTASAFLDLYEVTFDKSWVDKAVELEKYIQEHFYDQEGATYNFTSRNGQTLPITAVDYSDNVIPGAISTTANLLFRLGTLQSDDQKIESSKNLLEGVLGFFERSGDPGFYYGWMNLFHQLAMAPFEVVVIGPDYYEVLQQLQNSYVPNAIFLGGEDESGFDLLKNKLVEDETMIYVCRNKVCKLPTDDYTIALAQILANN